jgi:DNA-binding IclR family transcriptional regulator
MEHATSIDKAIDVLFHLHEDPTPLGVTAIGRALGIPKSSAHRLLAALSKRGLVEQGIDGRYEPGIALVALGIGVLEREPLVAAARPILEAEAEELGETVFLTAPRAGRLRVLDKVEGTGFLRAAPRVGGEIPLHATAVGRLHLAFAPDLVGLESSPFERFTPQTVVEAAELERAVRIAHRDGWAVNQGEWIAGVTVVAAPVFVAGAMRGAIAVAAHAAAAVTSDPARLAKRLVRAGQQIGRRIEGHLQ